MARTGRFVSWRVIPYPALLGRSDPDFFPSEQATIFYAGDDVVFAREQPTRVEEGINGSDGTLRTIWTRKFPRYTADGTLVVLTGGRSSRWHGAPS